MNADTLNALAEHTKKFGVSSKHLMAVLSDDAKTVAGCVMGLMKPGGSELRFGMQESKPTARMQAALDELVAGGAVIRCEERSGAVVYIPQLNMIDFYMWAAGNTGRDDLRFPITEPIR